MVNYNSAKKEYLKLDHADKKIRLMTLFEIFQTYSLSIQKMMPMLQSDQMKEEEMIQAYNNLVDAIKSVESEKLQVSMSKMDQLRIQIEKMREQEAKERVQENLEELLHDL